MKKDFVSQEDVGHKMWILLPINVWEEITKKLLF
jgi:hypothetical protein